MDKIILLVYLAVLLLAFLRFFIKSIKALYKIELIEDGETVRISTFHYSTLKSIECKREDFKLNIRKEMWRDHTTKEVQIFVNKRLYFTQLEVGVWTDERVAAIVYTDQDKKYKY